MEEGGRRHSYNQEGGGGGLPFGLSLSLSVSRAEVKKKQQVFYGEKGGREDLFLLAGKKCLCSVCSDRS